MSAGLERVKQKLRSHAKKAIEAGKAEAITQAEIFAGLARSFAPKKEGNLARSIRVEDADTLITRQGPTGFTGVVVKAGDESTVVTNESGGQFQNARLQEFGTQTRDANPYFYPAWRMRRRAARSAIRRAVRNAWKGQG